MLEVQNIEVVYSNVILVLRGVSFEVRPGQIVALMGPNGAGKSTTLKAISGLLRSELGEVTRGQILWDDHPIQNRDADEIVRKGIVQVIEGRPLFRHLTVEENLSLGGIVYENGRHIRDDLERVYTYFPRLRDLRKRVSGYLSGGEGQMLVIGRALMAHPRLLMLDEPSLGLAPLLVAEIFEIVKEINRKEGVSILLVEQNARAALSITHYGYVMENGRIVLDGSAEQLAANEDIKEFYLGLTQLGERKSYRDVKHYKRRKRWLG
ncbi:MAG: ABC transporter ATP-binding protein [Candidatus Thermofonsia Clade 1 bacterium]|jgi:branched-chain amino acid transport system ATP-binding protein|uniref:ABC transporter ATP-binding protein n=1 Tax=Candidatus Thermofonsia Clade 1 bacterium TaxID=2364210 RepID=A0A2M8PEF3_9CHLR|nr:MAG: ABC transporter ATP-binding protein [Candidatus Thermofonsia Clade 1 bacterium]RMF49046.1 MAG: ABC transporter ATP-binding protein [Chloroflexota bacterium]